jgi:RimJ/RimL family protein N-acetyltransferase
MDPWPLRHLVLRTPRLELRPDDDSGLLELAEVTQRGIHPPDFLPFLSPWTQNPPHEWLQHYWLCRAELSPAKWSLNFLVRLNGRVIGMQGVATKDFAVTREAHTGSWLGMSYQGQGYGTEMRAAVVMFAFDHLHADRMTSGAFVNNAASHAVSRKLGYRPDGTERLAVNGKLATNVRLLLTPETFVRPQWPVEVDGLDGCAELLGSGVSDR